MIVLSDVDVVRLVHSNPDVETPHPTPEVRLENRRDA